MITNFSFTHTPTIHFGVGELEHLGGHVRPWGTRGALVIGGRSLIHSSGLDRIRKILTDAEVEFEVVAIPSEPSPEMVDGAVARLRDQRIDVVVAVGGGSVIDGGKGISAMLRMSGSIRDYLEGVGTRTHTGDKVPFVAVPTTFGTGSEATKNAVITERGPGGFKKSLRHDAFVPEVAVVDPTLGAQMPDSLIASCGMDAFSQLVESFLSKKATPLTDALAVSGIEWVGRNLMDIFRGKRDAPRLSALAYGSLLSGITLANAGLGVIHGIAGPLGGFYDIPHGVACGTLLPEALKMTVKKMEIDLNSHRRCAEKFSRIALALSGVTRGDPVEDGWAVIETLETWLEELRIPRLGPFGIGPADVKKIVDASSCKNHPVALDKEEMASIVRSRL